MSYLSNAGRTRPLPKPVYVPAPMLWRGRPVTGLADAPPAAPVSEIPWKTIGILAAIPIVFAITGDK